MCVKEYSLRVGCHSESGVCVAARRRAGCQEALFLFASFAAPLQEAYAGAWGSCRRRPLEGRRVAPVIISLS